MAVTISADGKLDIGGAVVETSGGVKYAVFHDRTSVANIYIFKDIDGTPSQVYNNNLGVASAKTRIHAAIDSGDLIHIVVGNTSAIANSIRYAVLDTSDDSWSNAGEEVVVYNEALPSNPGVVISIDSSDIPHILFVDAVKVAGSTQDNVYYLNRSGGAWGSLAQIGARATKTDAYDHPTITLRNNDDVEAFYYFNTDGDPAYNYYTGGAWQGESVYNETTATVGFGGVTATTGGTVYRYHADDTEDIEENNVDTTFNCDTTQNRISATLVDNADRYVFYIDTSDDVHVISNTGAGWTDESAQQTGTYLYVISEWAYNNENQVDEINYIFSDSTTVYYDSFPLEVRIPRHPAAYFDGPTIF